MNIDKLAEDVSRLIGAFTGVEQGSKLLNAISQTIVESVIGNLAGSEEEEADKQLIGVISKSIEEYYNAPATQAIMDAVSIRIAQAVAKAKEWGNGLAIQFNAHTEFTLKTFPKASALSSLVKLKKELEELEAELTNTVRVDAYLREEYVDCIMCLFDSAAREGIDGDELQEAFQMKLEKNLRRKWKENGDGTYSHIPLHHRGNPCGYITCPMCSNGQYNDDGEPINYDETEM